MWYKRGISIPGRKLSHDTKWHKHYFTSYLFVFVFLREGVASYFRFCFLLFFAFVFLRKILLYGPNSTILYTGMFFGGFLLVYFSSSYYACFFVTLFSFFLIYTTLHYTPFLLFFI